MAKHGAEPGRSKTRHSHLKALQRTRGPELFQLGRTNRAETQIWLRANIVPLIREVDNPDGSNKTKLRPTALLESPLKQIESVAVDQHADHIIAMMQEQQV